MKIFLPIICFLFIVLLAGCSDKEDAVRWLGDSHAFAPPDANTADRVEPVTFETLPEEKPIVRIISGTEVSGMEEAVSIVSAKKPGFDLGLRTPVEQLALKEVPLIHVAAMLSEMSGYNIVVTRESAELPVSVFLQDIPLRQALEAICRLNDLWYREDERIVTLMTTEEYTEEMVIRRNEKSRAYWLRYTNANDIARILQAVMGSQVLFNDIGEEEVYGHVDEEKKGGTSVQLEDESGGSGAGAASTTMADLKGFTRDEVEKLMALGNLRGGKGDALALHSQIEKKVPAVVTVFKRNNAILARSLDKTILEDIGRIIELMDTPTSQVLLEISILQIELTEGFESFFQVDFPGISKVSYPDNLKDIDGNPLDPRSRTIPYTNLQGGTLGSSAGLSSQTLSLLFGNSNIQARMELFAKDDRVEVLATPYLMSANNSMVEFFVGEEVPLRDDVESNVLFNIDGFITTTTFDVNIIREELGTDLEISSFINVDGTITMDMDIEISSPKYNITTIGVVNESTGEVIQFPLDGVDRSELTSIVTGASGQMIAIGGVIRENLQESETKVPVLGDIPGLGFFFKEIHDKKVKSETVILLTPHIILHPALVGHVSREFLERRSSHPRFVRDQGNILDFTTKTGNNQRRGQERNEPADSDPFSGR